MPDIPRDVAEHSLDIRAGARPVRQPLRRFDEEKRRVIGEEIHKLMAAGFIKEVFHPEWLANPVLVRKKGGKWRMCVDYTGLNKACPKVPYPLPRIDQIVDSTAGCETLSFLDAYSAGVSSESLSKKINGKLIAVAVTVIGTLGAIFLPLYDITEFLYFIGSVFAPMIAIQIADFFLLKKNADRCSFNIQNLTIWLIGFIIYRLLMRVDILVGNTLPDMVITILLCVAVNKIEAKYARK